MRVNVHCVLAKDVLKIVTQQQEDAQNVLKDISSQEENVTHVLGKIIVKFAIELEILVSSVKQDIIQKGQDVRNVKRNNVQTIVTQRLDFAPNVLKDSIHWMELVSHAETN